ncbi:hypothetical protein AB7942_12785 [Neobacillus sp. BF23-41]|uniref:hypothetical protein n=1 Tax=Neobacillus sp. BF23-41 TaxID=3240280 RepID=UPI0034E5A33D
MTMLALAILFLMTVKVAMIGSIVKIVVAIVMGFIVAKLLLSGVSTTISSTKTTKYRDTIL